MTEGFFVLFQDFEGFGKIIFDYLSSLSTEIISVICDFHEEDTI